MFGHCVTLDQLAKEGPVERPDLDSALRLRARSDIGAARTIAEERTQCGSVSEAVRRARERL